MVCYPMCPVCGHPEGQHCEVLTFDETTGRGKFRHTPCRCGCEYYVKRRGVG